MIITISPFGEDCKYDKRKQQGPENLKSVQLKPGGETILDLLVWEY